MLTPVASFAEAWIENLWLSGKMKNRGVASFAEAWIENYFKMLAQKYVTPSPPSRRRGLKKKDELPLDHPNGSRLLRGGVD